MKPDEDALCGNRVVSGRLRGPRIVGGCDLNAYAPAPPASCNRYSLNLASSQKRWERGRDASW